MSLIELIVLLKPEMEAPQRYLITAALPYANGPLHVGHIAGAYLPADIYVRYLRYHQKDVVFVCGSDEHGVAITIQAKKENCTPREIIDKYHQLNGDTFERLGISFDIFHRTSSDLHHETSAGYFKELYDKGVFDEHESEQFYDEEFNQFLADRYIIGTCPRCGNDNAYGDQCEKCGTSLSPEDLISPRSALSGNSPIKKTTRHWYLPLNKYEGWLREWLVEGEGRTEQWKKNVLGQCKSWLDDGLAPRAITRDLDWGVKVPLKGAEGKVLYVWMDAPIGYMSATKQWANDNKLDWEPYWCDSNTKLVHFIGKDNIVFHCIIFPVLLKAHGGFILPTNVPANEFMNLEGQKMSTSRNWSLPVHEFLDRWEGYVDVMRYVLASNLPETKDSEFTWKDFQARNNNELVAILGNYVNRVLVLIHKFYEGRIPEMEDGFLETPEIKGFIDDLRTLTRESYVTAIENYRFREALQLAMDSVRSGNKLLTDMEPWKLFKTDPARCASVLRVCLEAMAEMTSLLYPFLPGTAEKIWKDTGLEKGSEQKPLGSRIKSGDSIATPTHLFSRIEDKAIDEEVTRLRSKNKVENMTEATALKPEISFEDFSKIDIRTGTIINAIKVPKTDKLLQLTVDMGDHQRTIVSGIAAHFDPEGLAGQRVLVVVNLAPRKMRGIESQGMVLMAEDSEGKLYFVSDQNSGQNGLLIS